MDLAMELGALFFFLLSLAGEVKYPFPSLHGVLPFPLCGLGVEGYGGGQIENTVFAVLYQHCIVWTR